MFRLVGPVDGCWWRQKISMPTTKIKHVICVRTQLITWVKIIYDQLFKKYAKFHISLHHVNDNHKFFNPWICLIKSFNISQIHYCNRKWIENKQLLTRVEKIAIILQYMLTKLLHVAHNLMGMSLRFLVILRLEKISLKWTNLLWIFKMCVYASICTAD